MRVAADRPWLLPVRCVAEVIVCDLWLDPTCGKSVTEGVAVRCSRDAETSYYHLQFNNLTPDNVTKLFDGALYGSVAQFSNPPGAPDTWYGNWQAGACPSTQGTLVVAAEPNKFPDEANGAPADVCAALRCALRGGTRTRECASQCGAVRTGCLFVLSAVWFQPSLETLKDAVTQNKGVLDIYARVDPHTNGTCVNNGAGCGYTVTMCAPPSWQGYNGYYCEGLIASGSYEQVC